MSSSCSQISQNLEYPAHNLVEYLEEEKKLTFILEYQINKVFINHVDSYNGKHLLDYFGKQAFQNPFQEIEQDLMGEGDYPFEERKSATKQRRSEVVSRGSASAGDEANRKSSTSRQMATTTDHSSGDSSNDDEGLGSAALRMPLPMNFPDEFYGEGVYQRGYPGYLKLEYPKIYYHGGESGESELPRSIVPESSLPCIPAFLEYLLTEEQLCCLLELETDECKAEYLKKIIIENAHPEWLPPEPVIKYLISGTLKYNETINSPYLYEVVSDIKAYLPTLLKCSTVIYDISRDPNQIEEARWALRAILCSFKYIESKSQMCFKKIKDVRKFILISSVMTWANTEKLKKNKPVSENDLVVRKPHKLFREHKILEQEVLRAGSKYKDIFKTYVVCSGITYGFEEDRLHYLFKMGWEDEPELPILGEGNNVLPLVHVYDLAMITFYAMSIIPESPTYMFAVEKNSPTLRQITEAVSRAFTSGRVVVTPAADVPPDNVKIHEDTFAMLKTNLLIKPIVTHIQLALPWRNPNVNMVDSIADVAQEYIESRGLLPLKIVIIGPPASGKTMLSKRVAEIYGLVYISPKDAVKDYIKKLQMETEKEIPVRGNDVLEGEGEEDGEDNEPEVTVGNVLTAAAELEEILNSSKQKGGIPNDQIVTRILKKKLEDMRTVNHGYILDGWPKTLFQGEALFGVLRTPEKEEPSPAELKGEGWGDEETEFGSIVGRDLPGDWGEGLESPTLIQIFRNFTITPNVVIQLEANCSDLLFRILAGKEDLEGTKPSSVALTQRFNDYKALEQNFMTGFDYFDAGTFETVLRFDIEKDRCPMLGMTLKKILDALGPPRNSGLMQAYLEQFKIIRDIKDQMKKDKMRAIAKGQEQKDHDYFMVARDFMDKWVQMKDTLLTDEKFCPDPFSLTNAEFISEYVVPKLVRALQAYKQSESKNYLEFFAEYFLAEFERDTGRALRRKTQQDMVQENTLFNRCVEAVLDNCDLSHLSMLPEALSIIKKYKRLTWARSCANGSKRLQASSMDMRDRKLSQRRSTGYSKFGDGSVLRGSVSKHDEEVTIVQKEASVLGFKELLEMLVATDPLWKEKLNLPPDWDKNLDAKMSDHSLKLLFECLNQIKQEVGEKINQLGPMWACSSSNSPTRGSVSSSDPSMEQIAHNVIELQKLTHQELDKTKSTSGSIPTPRTSYYV